MNNISVFINFFFINILYGKRFFIETIYVKKYFQIVRNYLIIL